MPHWSAEAPSNIALIKYMGKRDQNRPTNPSLSYTLYKLRSIVVIERRPEGEEDNWKPLEGGEWKPPHLSPLGRKKFLDHWAWLKEQLGLYGSFRVASANNFPSDCGMASSASSFAALTLCASRVAQWPDGGGEQGLSKESHGENNFKQLAQWSAKGSGSSCRSFLGPWVKWDNNEGVSSLSFPYKGLIHQVVVVSPLKKEISSSEAHIRVRTSLLNEGRGQRVEKRMEALKTALRLQDWASAFEITWAEFWDMHTLFETSQPSFGYMSPKSMDVLNKVRSFWRKHKDGPLVTMDAGPNVHLLYREDQRELQLQLNKDLKGYYLL